MKKSQLILVIIFLPMIFIKAQSVSENDSLYLIALEKYTVEIDSFYSRYSVNPFKYETIYLEETSLFKNIPDLVNGKEITILTDTNKEYIYNKNGNTLIQVKIFPLKVKNDLIEITVIPYHGKLVKNVSKNQINLNYSISLSDWTTIFFKFNCKTKKWKYYKTENGGI